MSNNDFLNSNNILNHEFNSNINNDNLYSTNYNPNTANTGFVPGNETYMMSSNNNLKDFEARNKLDPNSTNLNNRLGDQSNFGRAIGLDNTNLNNIENANNDVKERKDSKIGNTNNPLQAQTEIIADSTKLDQIQNNNKGSNQDQQVKPETQKQVINPVQEKFRKSFIAGSQGKQLGETANLLRNVLLILLFCAIIANLIMLEVFCLYMNNCYGEKYEMVNWYSHTIIPVLLVFLLLCILLFFSIEYVTRSLITILTVLLLIMGLIFAIFGAYGIALASIKKLEDFQSIWGEVSFQSQVYFYDNSIQNLFDVYKYKMLAVGITYIVFFIFCLVTAFLLSKYNDNAVEDWRPMLESKLSNERAERFNKYYELFHLDYRKVENTDLDDKVNASNSIIRNNLGNKLSNRDNVFNDKINKPNDNGLINEFNSNKEDLDRNFNNKNNQNDPTYNVSYTNNITSANRLNDRLFEREPSIRSDNENQVNSSNLNENNRMLQNKKVFNRLDRFKNIDNNINNDIGDGDINENQLRSNTVVNNKFADKTENRFSNRLADIGEEDIEEIENPATSNIGYNINRYNNFDNNEEDKNFEGTNNTKTKSLLKRKSKK